MGKAKIQEQYNNEGKNLVEGQVVMWTIMMKTKY
jgi:hypothetical protein